MLVLSRKLGERKLRGEVKHETAANLGRSSIIIDQTETR